MAGQAVRDAWRKLIIVHGAADGATDRFGPLFEALLVAAASDPVVGELHPYQLANQLCLRRPGEEAPADDAGLPAVSVGPNGTYLVVDRRGPGAAVVLETRSVREALECVASLLAPASS